MAHVVPAPESLEEFSAGRRRFRVYWCWAAEPSRLCWRESQDLGQLGLVVGAVERDAVSPFQGLDGPFVVEVWGRRRANPSVEEWAAFEAWRAFALDMGAADLGLLMPVED